MAPSVSTWTRSCGQTTSSLHHKLPSWLVMKCNHIWRMGNANSRVFLACLASLPLPVVSSIMTLTMASSLQRYFPAANQFIAHNLLKTLFAGELSSNSFLLHSAISSSVTLASIFYMSKVSGANKFKFCKARDWPSFEGRSISCFLGGKTGI